MRPGALNVAQPNRKATYRTCGPAAYVGVGDGSTTAGTAQKRTEGDGDRQEQ